MSRLPTPGEDNGNWGEILNDFLEQSHNDDGSLKETAISTKEDVSNKSTDITTDADSDTKYPSVKATKTYTDDKIGEVNAQLAFTPFTATLEEGTIAWEGSTADDVDMARTKNFILAGAGTSLRLESVTYQFCVCLYDNTYSFIESSDWIDDEEVYTVPYDAYIKIKFERDDFTGPIDETERAVILAVMKIKARTITTFLDGVEETGYAPLSTPFESGGFYWNCTPQVNTSQIRTVGFILVGAGTILTLNSTLYTFVVYLCNKDYTYIESSEWIPGLISYTIPYDAYIRVKVEREDEAVIDETERNAIAALFRIKATPVTTFLDDEGFSTLSVPFESGDIGWWGGVDDPYPNRVRTAEFTLVGAGTVIRLKSSAYEFYVFLYDKGFKIIESIG
ncbi:MAG: hypothetical protein EOM23_02735, partial [Candidatus Moranbacteria bacterium]|nr:hypothetical protein [Candidatus Moranbacteria bacterium]